MKILALDLGNNTGWAVYKDGNVLSDVKDFTPKYHISDGMRARHFKQWLENFHNKDDKLDVVYYEEVQRSHRSIRAAAIYFGYRAILQVFCEENNIPFEGVPVKTLKKHATGNGGAKKEAMIAKANFLGCATKDDNQADAICLLYLALGRENVSKQKQGYEGLFD